MTAVATQELVAGEGEEDRSEMNEQYLIFAVCEESYGIPISDVLEIISVSHITPVPKQPAYLTGIMNNRGTILPVMDVRLRFNREAGEYDDRTCVIVLVINDMHVGLIVDTVLEVLTIPEEEIVVPPPSTSNHYVMGIGKVGDGVRLLVDGKKLLDEISIEDEADA